MAKKKSGKPKLGPKAAPKRQSARKPKAEPRSIEEVIVDPRAIEAMMWGQFGPKDAEPSIAAAQELIYEAFGQSDSKKRAKLAKAALDLSADCADAYVILAEQAKGRGEAIDLYRKGVAAGERALGPDLFREEVGHFWGILETRPYMRSRFALARALWTEGEHEEAADHLLDMLRLNPGDNQGLRYTLASWLIKLDRDDQLARLLGEYDEDSSTWTFTKALLAFRLNGDSPASVQILKAAEKTNPHVRPYLIGEQPIPLGSPSYYSPGEESEAILYVQENLGAWRSTPGAVTWAAASLKPKPTKAAPAKVPKGTSTSLLSKVHRQTDEWQVDFLRLPTPLDEGDGPVLPSIILVANRTTGKILHQDVIPGEPSPGEIWDAVTQAIRKPSHGKSHRPSMVEIPEDPIWDGIQANFEQIGVECVRSEKLDMISDLFDDLLSQFGGPEPDALVDIPGTSPERIGEFFDAAADFYREGLWKTAPPDRPIEIKCETFANRPWYVVVMGQMGVSLGVALYPDLNLLKRIISGKISEEENVLETVAMSLTFDPEDMAIPTDVDAANGHDWSVAGPEAFPSVMFKERGMSQRAVTADELSLIEACIRTLPKFLRSIKPSNRVENESVVTVDGKQANVSLSWIKI